MQSRLIDGLEWDLDEDGSGGLCNVHGDKVHLRQGDMDGACGPYCLVMAMLVRGQLRRRQAKGLERVDSRSRYGRLMKRWTSTARCCASAPPASTCWSCWPRSTIRSISPSRARGAGWSGTPANTWRPAFR